MLSVTFTLGDMKRTKKQQSNVCDVHSTATTCMVVDTCLNKLVG